MAGSSNRQRKEITLNPPLALQAIESLFTLPTPAPRREFLVMPSPSAIYPRAGLLIGLGLVVAYVTLSLTETGPSPNRLVMDLMFGTMFQHALLAGTWCVLGPGQLNWRVPLSFVWAVLMGLIMLLPRSISGVDPTAYVAVLIAAAMWLAVQLPLWVLALCFRLRLWHQGTPSNERTARQSQFGIGQLMAVTAFVAVVLAVGRLLLAYQLQRPGAYFNPDWLLPAVLVAAQVVMFVPLSLACLLPRYVLPSALVSVLFIAAVTAGEVPIAMRMTGFGNSSELWLMFGTTNACSACWTLAFAAVVRGSGYHLGVPSRPAPLPSVEASP